MRKLGLAAVLAALASIAGGGSASAGVVTFGADLKTLPTTKYVCGELGGCTYASNSPAFVAPISGTIIRWRVHSFGGTFTLRVLRGNRGVVTGPPQVTTGLGVQTFPAKIPVSVGDRIGVDFPEDFSTEIGVAAPGVGDIQTWLPRLPDGATRAPEETYDDVLPLLNADVLPPPTVSGIATSSGPVTGGSTVVITGTEFAEVRSVDFAGRPAGFSVDFEGQITATAPAGKPGAATVSVTTAAGTATSPTGFTYTACVVPRLKGKTLKADRRLLRKAGCTLGKVRGERRKGAKVKKQTRAPGTILPPGAKVGVKLG